MIHAYFAKEKGPNGEFGVALHCIQSLNEWQEIAERMVGATPMRRLFEERGFTHFTPKIDWWPDKRSFYAGLPGAATITCHDLQIIVHDSYQNALTAWQSYEDSKEDWNLS